MQLLASLQEKHGTEKKYVPVKRQVGIIVILIHKCEKHSSKFKTKALFDNKKLFEIVIINARIFKPWLHVHFFCLHKCCDCVSVMPKLCPGLPKLCLVHAKIVCTLLKHTRNYKLYIFSEVI